MDLSRIIPLLPEDWAGRRISIEWTDCQKHVGCKPEWFVTAERTSDDHIIASATSENLDDALKGLEFILQAMPRD